MRENSREISVVAYSTPQDVYEESLGPDFQKGEGAGLYLEVHPQWVWMGGGFWAPHTPQLVRIREHIATTWPEIHDLARAETRWLSLNRFNLLSFHEADHGDGGFIEDKGQRVIAFDIL